MQTYADQWRGMDKYYLWHANDSVILTVTNLATNYNNSIGEISQHNL